MATTTDNEKRIAAINAILETGVATVTVDGQTVTYDLESLRRERRRLIEADTTRKGSRPVVSTIRLGG